MKNKKRNLQNHPPEWDGNQRKHRADDHQFGCIGGIPAVLGCQDDRRRAAGHRGKNHPHSDEQAVDTQQLPDHQGDQRNQDKPKKGELHEIPIDVQVLPLHLSEQ